MLSRSKKAAACGSGPIERLGQDLRGPGAGLRASRARRSRHLGPAGPRRAVGPGGLRRAAVARHLHPTHPNRRRVLRGADGRRSGRAGTGSACDRLAPWSLPSPRTRRILVRTGQTRVTTGPKRVSNLSLLAALQAAASAGPAGARGAGVRAITWAELNRRVDAVAAGLVGTGLLAGQRIGLDGGNSIAWVVAYLAALRAGLVVVPTDPDESTDERDSLLAACGARAVLTTRGAADERIPSLELSEEGLAALDLDRDRGGHPTGRGVARGHRHHARHQRRPEDRDAQPSRAAGPPAAGQRLRHRRRRQRRPRGAALLPRVRTQRRARQLSGRRRPPGAARSGDLGSAHGDRSGAGRQPADHPGAALPPGARRGCRRPAAPGCERSWSVAHRCPGDSAGGSPSGPVCGWSGATG